MKKILLSAGLLLSLSVQSAFAQESLTTTTSSTTGTSTATATPVTVAAPDDLTSSIKTEPIPGGDVKIGDFVVGPGKIEVTVKPGESVTKEIMLTNRIDDNRQFQFTVEDMSGSADGSQSVVLLGDQRGPYSIKDYLTIPKGHLTLKLGQRAHIPITITVPKDAEPGGYYGSVLINTIQDDGKNPDGTVGRSPIIARIGTLFFVTVPGKADIEGVIKHFAPIGDQWLFTKGPINLGITYENTGSVHLNPYGEIHITNMFGSEVGYVEIEPWFILPKSLRTREVIWNSDFLLGRYKITAQINRGYDNQVDTMSYVVWVLPWQVVLPVFAGLFLIIFIIRLFFSKFEFKRK